MGEKLNSYRVLVGKPDGKTPLGRPRRRWEYNSKIDPSETGWGGMDWVNFLRRGSSRELL
jgi:hypothetical protein